MAVSISTPYTSSTRQALSTSMRDASMAASKMSTGKNYVHAYEDSTGFAIGSSMQSDLKILEIVATGVNQTQSMLYMVEEGMKAIHDTASKLNQVLAKAKLGYMTDELVKNTLSPSYIQLKQEIDRIADSIEFNGQKLLNGTGGKQVAASTAAVGAASYKFSNYSNTSLSGVTAITGLTPGFTGATGTVTPTYTNSKFTLSGGTIAQVGNDVTITGATLTVSNVDLADGAVTPVTGSADLEISNVDITLTAPSFDAASNKLSATGAAVAVTLSSTASDYVFSNLSSSLSGWTAGTNTLASQALSGTLSSEIDSVSRTYALSGGIGASSTFNFVTGSDLNESVVEVSFPNMRLTAANNIPGMISTINTQDNVRSAAPTDLSNLETIADADSDIPLVQALVDQIIVHFSQIGAYQSRLINIQSQLSTSVEQVDLAQGEIMNADLAKENENFTRSNVKINVAIAVLGQMNSSLQSLQRLVQG